MILVRAGFRLIVHLVIIPPAFYLALANDLPAEVYEDFIDIGFGRQLYCFHVG